MTAIEADAKRLAKEEAAKAALDYVEDGMILGLGSGSTAELFIARLGERVKKGLRVRGIATSEMTRRAAEAAKVPLIPIDEAERVDLTVDGADEVEMRRFYLVKGGGGCLLREKIVAASSDHMVVIIDRAKVVRELGAFPLPVEVDPFGFTITAKKIFDALRSTLCRAAEVTLREGADAKPFVTDGGHYILDCAAGSIAQPRALAQALNAIPGVVEHGLFIDLARTVIVGEPDGVEILER